MCVCIYIHRNKFLLSKSNRRCYITIKWYYEIQKPLTAFDFMIESRAFVM